MAKKVSHTFAEEVTDMTNTKLQSQYERLNDLRDPADSKNTGIAISERMMALYWEGQSRDLDVANW